VIAKTVEPLVMVSYDPSTAFVPLLEINFVYHYIMEAVENKNKFIIIGEHLGIPLSSTNPNCNSHVLSENGWGF
jgi:hypothetical protein